MQLIGQDEGAGKERDIQDAITALLQDKIRQSQGMERGGGAGEGDGDDDGDDDGEMGDGRPPSSQVSDSTVTVGELQLEATMALVPFETGLLASKTLAVVKQICHDQDLPKLQRVKKLLHSSRKLRDGLTI